jgi:hypothetical protein
MKHTDNRMILHSIPTALERVICRLLHNPRHDMTNKLQSLPNTTPLFNSSGSSEI